MNEIVYWVEKNHRGTTAGYRLLTEYKNACQTLKDNKSRDFYLIGKPDLVIKFDEKGFGIMDFKTTTEDDKTQGYRFQLEAYAQIFENPGELKSSKTPELAPITHLGLIQFTPKDIYKHDLVMFQQNFKINYYPLIRNEETIADFFDIFSF